MKNNFNNKNQKSSGSAEVQERKTRGPLEKKARQNNKEKRHVKNMLRSIVNCNDYESLRYDDYDEEVF